MDGTRLVAAFVLWSVAFIATAVGYWYTLLGRDRVAGLALVVCVGAFAGMFRIGRHRARSS